jgi:indolepyruvate ferredoxin oxidoreductase beta subunit
MTVSRLRILFAGVGGQGVLSAGRWVGDAAAAAGIDVVVGQIHGMSQRGGSVQATVALGGARSAEIPRGMADLLVAFEPMEGARALAQLSERSTAIINTRPLLPVSLQATGRPYPPVASLISPIEEVAGSVIALDASALAENAGSPRSLNVVALGMLAGSGLLPFPDEALLAIIQSAGMPAFAEVNGKAFRLGSERVKEVFEH